MEERLHLYVIVRRDRRRSRAALEQAPGRPADAGEETSDDIRWIRSYVIDDGGGSVGTICIYEATSPATIREHARHADLPVDEIIAVADTVVVRPDPSPVRS